VHDPVPNRIRMHPKAEGTLSRLAVERARAAGIDVTPLMVKAGVTCSRSKKKTFGSLCKARSNLSS
jgi:hypothetical protein